MEAQIDGVPLLLDADCKLDGSPETHRYGQIGRSGQSVQATNRL